MQKRSELARLWAVIRTEPGEWFKIVPYVVPFLVAALSLHVGITRLFYGVVVPTYAGYAIGYLVIWFPKRRRQEAYVRFAAVFCAFNLVLLYVTPGGIVRVQVVVLAIFIYTGFSWERILARKSPKE